MRSGRFTLLIIVALLACSAAGFFQFVKPKVQELRAAQKAVALAQAQLNQGQDIVQGYKDLKAAVDKNAQALAKLDVALPVRQEKSSDVPELLLFFQDIAEHEAGGMILQQIQVGEPAATFTGGTKKGSSKIEPNTLLTRQISISGIASYDALKRFVQATARSLRLAEPTQLTFIFSSDPSQSIVNFTASFRVFLYEP